MRTLQIFEAEPGVENALEKRADTFGRSDLDMRIGRPAANGLDDLTRLRK